MFGFIRNWFKPKTFKEVKEEYKNLKSKEKELEDLCTGHKIIEQMFGIYPRIGQEDCPELLVHLFKKLLVRGHSDEVEARH